MNRVNVPRRTQVLTPLALALLAAFPLWTQAATIESAGVDSATLAVDTSVEPDAWRRAVGGGGAQEYRAEAVVRQLADHVQGDAELIARLKDAGVVPNARVTVESADHGGVNIVIPGHEQVGLPHHMAHAVKVEKV